MPGAAGMPLHRAARQTPEGGMLCAAGSSPLCSTPIRLAPPAPSQPLTHLRPRCPQILGPGGWYCLALSQPLTRLRPHHPYSPVHLPSPPNCPAPSPPPHCSPEHLHCPHCAIVPSAPLPRCRLPSPLHPRRCAHLRPPPPLQGPSVGPPHLHPAQPPPRSSSCPHPSGPWTNLHSCPALAKAKPCRRPQPWPLQHHQPACCLPPRRIPRGPAS